MPTKPKRLSILHQNGWVLVRFLFNKTLDLKSFFRKWRQSSEMRTDLEDSRIAPWAEDMPTFASNYERFHYLNRLAEIVCEISHTTTILQRKDYYTYDSTNTCLNRKGTFISHEKKPSLNEEGWI